ncbi:HTH-type transcriptional regulator MhqR [Andreprevotia sp. IGB-42]|uniref:MarR family winged helix-turn-helix transcriptional regulator n=1 Tax=Andreprevotia sp. IGB-42 TaxID=2497473 RepID=UPI00135B6DDF|nr:MarR family transcriptional regulator [Andreprevotia sp. IGB-42]KAF0813007.1 HTH-type transcriptional regulator MhqR [Andreprevotia sp. IGB-42]
MAKDRFLPLLRELARCYQAFELCSSRHLRTLGLTPPQFDIIATLGNTNGMSCGELGDQTLITKGTLTGVIDRLAARGLLQRTTSDTDRRSVIVKLTPEGQALFDEVFPAHLAHLRRYFVPLDDEMLALMQKEFHLLRLAFEQEPAETV